MTLGIGMLCQEGVLLLTDSATSYKLHDGTYHHDLVSKFCHILSPPITVAPAGSFQFPAMPFTTWPNGIWPVCFGPDRELRQFETFDEAVYTLADEVESLSVGNRYELLLAGREWDQFPKLARVSGDDGIDFGLIGSIFVAGMVSVPPGTVVPATLTGCRDLAIVLAADAIASRDPGAPADSGSPGPHIGWPLHIETWAWGNRGGHLESWRDVEQIEESNALVNDCKRRRYVASVLGQAVTQLTATLLATLEAGLDPAEIASIAFRPTISKKPAKETTE